MPGVNSVLIVILIIAVFFCHLRINALFDLLEQTHKTNIETNKLYDKKLDLYFNALIHLETRIKNILEKDTRESLEASNE